jgi:hypothetical protein
MIENFELVSITTLILILTLISLYPLIYLKYMKDLNNNIEKYNTICTNKKGVYDKNSIKIKNTYMWNLSIYIFDFDRISQNFNYKNSKSDSDTIPINRNYSIINGQLNIMKVYNDYLHYSIPLFIALWLVFLLNLSIVFSNVYNTRDVSDASDAGNVKSNNYAYSIIFAFINVAIFTIIFSLILKKITEIYIDTDLFNYIMLLKELDIIIKENNDEEDNNKKIIDIIRKSSIDENINSIADVPFNIQLFRELSDLKTGALSNNNNYKLTLQNIDKFESYNKKKSISKINDEIDDVTQYITAYFILIFMSIYILSQAIKSNFLIISFIIISIYIFYIIGQVGKKNLE